MTESDDREPLIVGSKHHPDSSQTFGFVNGPYHGMRFRVYPPYDDVTFPNVGTYRLHEPIRKRGKWVYAYVEPVEQAA